MRSASRRSSRCPGVFHTPRRRARPTPRGAERWRDEDRRRRQDRLGHAGLRPGARGARRRRHPVRGRRGGGRRDPQQQVHLQHARADQRPHGQGRQGRHHRRRARPPPGAVRLLGPRARVAWRRATSSRCSTSAACSGICDSVNPDKGKPFDCRVLGVVLQFPVSRRAHRRAGARRLRSARPRRAARHARRAGRRARRHLHGSRQDRRGLRDRRAHAPSRPDRGRVQGDRRLAAARHPGDGGRRRAPLR